MGWYQRGSGFVVQVGLTIDRPTKVLPQTATEALFTITGGRILVRQILGEVTTVVQAQATTLKLASNPTVTGTSVDLCAVGDLNAAPVGSLLGISGTAATALQLGLAVLAQVTPLILQPGTIDAVTVASSTGSVKWTLVYSPLDTAALVSTAA